MKPRTLKEPRTTLNLKNSELRSPLDLGKATKAFEEQARRFVRAKLDTNAHPASSKRLQVDRRVGYILLLDDSWIGREVSVSVSAVG